jgi:sulfofructose kinase
VSKVVCIGVAALDCIMQVDALPGPDQRIPARGAVLAGGGPAATAAVALTRLGVQAALCTVIGDDEPGRFISEGLAREGVNTDLVAVRAGYPSALSVAIVPDALPGMRSLIAHREAAIPRLTDELATRCEDADWVHVDHAGWPVVAWLREQGVRTPISVDGGNPIPDLSLDGVTLYAPSATELIRRSGANGLASALERSIEEGAAITVATMGAEGAVCLSTVDPTTNPMAVPAAQDAPIREGVRWTLHADAHPVDVVSSLGAGDVYHGALLAALVRGQSLEGALRVAAVAAAMSCAGLDGRSAIPSWDEAVRRMAPIDVRTERVAPTMPVHA